MGRVRIRRAGLATSRLSHPLFLTLSLSRSIPADYNGRLTQRAFAHSRFLEFAITSEIRRDSERQTGRAFIFNSLHLFLFGFCIARICRTKVSTHRRLCA